MKAFVNSECFHFVNEKTDKALAKKRMQALKMCRRGCDARDCRAVSEVRDSELARTK